MHVLTPHSPASYTLSVAVPSSSQVFMSDMSSVCHCSWLPTMQLLPSLLKSIWPEALSGTLTTTTPHFKLSEKSLWNTNGLEIKPPTAGFTLKFHDEFSFIERGFRLMFLIDSCFGTKQNVCLKIRLMMLFLVCTCCIHNSFDVMAAYDKCLLKLRSYCSLPLSLLLTNTRMCMM